MPINMPTLKRYANNKVFVETGSYIGYCVQFALDAGFETIISIEISKKFADYCNRRFSNKPNVHIIQGDSSDILWDVIKNINVPITFWLDGHYSGGDDTMLGRYLSPLVQELDAISRHPVKSHTILVDDMRCWREVNNCFHNGFNTESLMRRIRDINPAYKIDFVDGIVCNSNVCLGGVVGGVDAYVLASNCNGNNGEVFPADILAATI